MTNARKICLLLSFFLYILNASAQEEIKKDTTAQNSKGVLVNLTDGIATTVRHTGRKIRKVGKSSMLSTPLSSPPTFIIWRLCWNTAVGMNITDWEATATTVNKA